MQIGLMLPYNTLLVSVAKYKALFGADILVAVGIGA